MAMQGNQGLRQMIQSSREVPLVMATSNIPSGDMIEIAGFASFDLVMIDGEHGALSPRDIQEMIRAADACGLPTIVRVPVATKELILRALDSGAGGIVVPRINNREEALQVVAQCRYPPLGKRGSGMYVRAHHYTLIPESDAFAAADEVAVGVMIESEEGVANAEEIISTPGVDFILVGPSDLAVDTGERVVGGNPWVEQAVERIGNLAREAGVPVGIPAPTPEIAKVYKDQGYNFFVTGLGPMLARSGVRYTQTMREALGVPSGRSVG